MRLATEDSKINVDVNFTELRKNYKSIYLIMSSGMRN